MYEVFITKVYGETESHRCKTVCEVLELFDKLDDSEISSISIKRLETE